MICLPRVAALAQRVGGTETGMADLRGALAELTSAMTVLKGRVDQVETDIAALKALDARLAAIGGKIVALEATALTKEEQASVQTLTTTLVSLRGEIDTELNKKLVLADLSELTNKITALETGKADKTTLDILKKAVEDKQLALDAANKLGASADRRLQDAHLRAGSGG